jgi:hypothetical protein
MSDLILDLFILFLFLDFQRRLLDNSSDQRNMRQGMMTIPLLSLSMFNIKLDIQ